jgi:quercetin dioxygenase-like cupin family protein
MSIAVCRYRESVAFGAQRFNPVPIEGNERARALLVCFEPGQFIAVHRPRVDLTVVALEGEGLLVAGERDESIVPGTIAFVPAGEVHGVPATTRLVVLTVVTPPPTDADHAEVASRLRRGAFR